jgi:hypothetical protein
MNGHPVVGFTHEYPAYSLTSKYSRTYPDHNAILSSLNDNRTHESELEEIRQIQHSSSSSSSSSSHHHVIRWD